MIDFWIFPLSTIWRAYQNTGFRHFNPLLKLAKFDVILIRFRSFSILCSFESSGFSTHYFSFHTLVVLIQYQLFFVTIVCSSGGLQVI